MLIQFKVTGQKRKANCSDDGHKHLFILSVRHNGSKSAKAVFSLSLRECQKDRSPSAVGAGLGWETLKRGACLDILLCPLPRCAHVRPTVALR